MDNCFEEDGSVCVNASSSECTGDADSDNYTIADQGLCFCDGSDLNGDGSITGDEPDSCIDSDGEECTPHPSETSTSVDESYACQTAGGFISPGAPSKPD